MLPSKPRAKTFSSPELFPFLRQEIKTRQIKSKASGAANINWATLQDGLFNTFHGASDYKLALWIATLAASYSTLFLLVWLFPILHLPLKEK